MRSAAHVDLARSFFIVRAPSHVSQPTLATGKEGKVRCRNIVRDIHSTRGKKEDFTLFGAQSGLSPVK